jgi:hypothetical protein
MSVQFAFQGLLVPESWLDNIHTVSLNVCVWSLQEDDGDCGAIHYIYLGYNKTLQPMYSIYQ